MKKDNIENQLAYLRKDKKVAGKTMATTKLFDRKQCRSCGSKGIVKSVCLDCNEPTGTWCENCFTIEDFGHVGHMQLDLF